MSALLAVTALLVAGCSDDGQPAESHKRRPTSAAALPERPEPRARCPTDLTGCRTASGRILHVERVDPDGDGDAHFVLASREAVTAPGISVIDVRSDLRPHPLPGPGDRLSAAGRVQVGTYGQRQIEAVAVEAAR